VIPALLLGRRAGCHVLCWMAPFMVVGRAIRNLMRWPALRLRSDSSLCIGCGACSEACPMSIDVQKLVARQRMEHRDCILCGSCVDRCRKSTIRYSFSPGVDA
jgi:NAD-dependent dihydropyrimidine dehydrogenase PreA subunit